MSHANNMIKQAAHNPKKDDVDFGDDINNGSRGAAAGVNACVHQKMVGQPPCCTSPSIIIIIIIIINNNNIIIINFSNCIRQTSRP